ncbi:DUF1456 family protein [Vibrio metschnikovii]|uniref:DUF1456 family protein n=1 Tax=Vibrio metschnikovii TaxID=28172 RepID=UPI001C2F5EAF|nr:DUF1456 family protein [Vibrio metschnikovii]MDA3138385.1 DUF1456 family protein [Vibrio metschnikovii]MDM7486022.1 DUF1456 family protein [Vibrio metschnikovii]
MTNNDIFCALRTTFAFNDQTLLEIFHLADNETTPAQLASWLSKPQTPEFAELSDPQLASFLNGLINLKRGKREGEAAKPEANLNNNMVFQKLRIALNLQADDLLILFQQVGVELSKNEIGAFFRKPGNKHYRECSDATLRQFLQAVEHHTPAITE